MKKKKPLRSRPEKRRYSEDFLLYIVILLFGAFTLLLEFLTHNL
nr:MAG TPA: hypothetical protein [Caudoviricetes sp.]